MQYYTFIFDGKSKNLFTIATPFGIYKYNQLPIGICQSPNIAQKIMELVLCDIIDIKVYIDDIAFFSQCFDSNMKGTVRT